jgi:hypothetical protein
MEALLKYLCIPSTDHTQGLVSSVSTDNTRQNIAKNMIVKKDRLFLVRITVEDMKFGDG